MFEQSLDRFFEKNGICKIRSTSSFLKHHSVLVNGERVFDISTKIDSENDRIFVDGVQIKNKKNIYVMMNKGLGVVCSRVSDSHKTIYDFFADSIATDSNTTDSNTNFANDKNFHSCSTGLIFLTNNGSFSNFFEEPKNHLKKKYKVELEFPVSESEQKEYKEKIAKGFYIPPLKKDTGFTSKSANVEFQSQTKGTITLTEGKFRQVRRMFIQLGNNVVNLKRIEIGDIILDESLEENNWRFLTQKELETLWNQKRTIEHLSKNK